MKKITILVLVATLSLTTFACINNVNASQASTTTNESETTTNIVENTDKNSEKEDNAKAEESLLTTKIKNLCNKEIVKKSANGKSISSQMKDTISELSSNERDTFKKTFPEISLDEANFENDEKTYIWLSDTLKTILKTSINNGNITQEKVDDIVTENKVYLTLMGISIPNVKIEPGISDENVEKLAITLVDIADRVMDPMVLKLIGADTDNLNVFEMMINLLQNM